jgi:hypothetical protein
VLPPSRGRRKAGALAPSAKPGLGEGDVPAAFNPIEGASFDASKVACPGFLVTFLPELPAMIGRVFEGGDFAD